jgi:hypothetical protein
MSNPFLSYINHSAARTTDICSSKHKDMKTAKELLLAYLENIGNPDPQIELFADDAVFELPYLASLALPARWEGREVLYNFLSNLPRTFPGFKFKNIQIHIDTPD